MGYSKQLKNVSLLDLKAATAAILKQLNLVQDESERRLTAIEQAIKQLKEAQNQ